MYIRYRSIADKTVREIYLKSGKIIKKNVGGNPDVPKLSIRPEVGGYSLYWPVSICSAGFDRPLLVTAPDIFDPNSTYFSPIFVGFNIWTLHLRTIIKKYLRREYHNGKCPLSLNKIKQMLAKIKQMLGIWGIHVYMPHKCRSGLTNIAYI